MSSRNPNSRYAVSPWLLPLLAVVSALIGFFCAYLFFGVGAILLLEGTGRGQLPGMLSGLGSIVALVGSVFMLWLALALGRRVRRVLRWGWLALCQLIVVLLALGTTLYGDLRPILALPLLFGLICNVVLLLNLRVAAARL
jgi:uncharacterized membrane protein YhaH (DUF805 family)